MTRSIAPHRPPRRRLLPLPWSVLLHACAGAHAVAADPGMHARSTLQRMVRDQELPGAQYVAVTAQETLLEVHAGVAVAADGRAMTQGTVQMAYSITKVLTAIAVLQLADQGKLALDRPLSEYVAHPYGPGVTLRGLLAHTAGIPNPMPLDWFALEHEPLDRDARLRAVLERNAELDAEPGAAYGYTNLGYWLLEEAIEAASGQDYAAYVQANVFGRLDVPEAAARFELPQASIGAVGHARSARPLTWLMRALTPSRYWLPSRGGWVQSARLRSHGRAYGGLYTSATALAPVLQDLLRDAPRLLSPQARRQMLAEQHTRGGEGTSATLGWVVGELEGVRYLGKQGGGLGFHGNVRIYPTLGLATVLLANTTEIAPGPIDARSDAIDVGFVRARAGGAI